MRLRNEAFNMEEYVKENMDNVLRTEANIQVCCNFSAKGLTHTIDDFQKDILKIFSYKYIIKKDNVLNNYIDIFSFFYLSIETKKKKRIKLLFLGTYEVTINEYNHICGIFQADLSLTHQTS